MASKHLRVGSSSIATATATALILSFHCFEDYFLSNESSPITHKRTAALSSKDNGDIQTRFSHHLQAHASSPSNRQFNPSTQNTESLRVATLQDLILSSQRDHSRLKADARCDADASANEVLWNEGRSTSTVVEGADGTEFYYLQMNPDDLMRTSLLNSHAIFGTLCGTGLIERYHVYRRVPLSIGREKVDSKASTSKEELTVVDLELGGRLNGHGGIVHGGIISLVFDEAMGWACECLRLKAREEEANNSLERDLPSSSEQQSPSTVVTANLTVNFRAPLFENSKAVVRVFHKCTDGRKISFSARLESHDGKVVYAEAESLFIIIKSKVLKRTNGEKE